MNWKETITQVDYVLMNRYFHILVVRVHDDMVFIVLKNRLIRWWSIADTKSFGLATLSNCENTTSQLLFIALCSLSVTVCPITFSFLLSSGFCGNGEAPLVCPGKGEECFCCFFCDKVRSQSWSKLHTADSVKCYERFFYVQTIQ